MIAQGLLTVSGWLGFTSLVGLFVAGAAGFFLPDEPVVWAIFLAAALGFILAIILLLAGLGIDAEVDRRAVLAMREERHPFIPLVRIDKPDDYNASVTHHFFNGPELRERDDSFRKGFNARAMVPPPSRKP